MSEPVILCHRTVTQGDWTIKIHTRHGVQVYDRPHVHISKRGIKGEYSWNVDGTRHDAHRFPSSEQCIEKAKRIASNHLGIDISKLKFGTIITCGLRVTFSERGSRPLVNFFVFPGKAAVALLSDDWIIFVIDDV